MAFMLKDAYNGLLLKKGYQMNEEKIFKDILLCKHSKDAALIFDTVLRQIGYSVEIVEDLESFKEMLHRKKFRYALFDKDISGLYEDIEVDVLLKQTHTKSIAFFDKLRLATPRDYRTYTLIAPNVPSSELLHTLLLKLEVS